MRASVCILTKNPGPIFESVLSAALDQITPWPYEVIVIDSGSTDGTVELIDATPGVRLYQIPPHTFGHGRTRNLAVQLTSGEYVAFLTHDAKPADRHWLANLVDKFGYGEDVAGVFGRHIASPEASPFMARDLDMHFDGFRRQGPVFRIEDRQRYDADVGYRQFLHFFSSNNAAIRRRVWDQIPFPEVDFAEDQTWAKSIIEAGFAKAYAHDAVVVHSHEFGFVETARRSFDESSAFHRYFGYVLSPSRKDAVRQAVATTKRDWRYFRDRRLPLREAHWLGRITLRNATKQLGYYLGHKSDELSDPVKLVISRDKSMKAGSKLAAVVPGSVRKAGKKATKRAKRVTKGVRRRAGRVASVVRNEGPAGLASLAGRWVGRRRGDDAEVPTADAPLEPPVDDLETLLAQVEEPDVVEEPVALDDEDAPDSHLIDVGSHYDFVLRSPFGRPIGDYVDVGATINWVIPPFLAGSGGHLNIFRLVYNLEKAGFQCRIVVEEPNQFESSDEARDAIHAHFFPIEAEVSLGADSLRPAWATVATGWQTAYAVRDFQSTLRKLYFVQDFEPDFFAAGSERSFAEATYRFGFTGITAGDWLATKLSGDYGMETFTYGFSYDRHLYSPPTTDRPPRAKKRVLFYARPVTLRRGFETGLLALEELCRRHDDVEVITAGWDLSDYKLPFPATDLGVLPLEKLPILYRECDLALILSFTNLSLLPLEVMASGVPIVSNRGPNVEWMLNDEIAALSDPEPEALAETMSKLLNDPDELQRLSHAAVEFARTTSWEDEATKLAAHLHDLWVKDSLRLRDGFGVDRIGDDA